MGSKPQGNLSIADSTTEKGILGAISLANSRRRMGSASDKDEMIMKEL